MLQELAKEQIETFKLEREALYIFSNGSYEGKKERKGKKLKKVDLREQLMEEDGNREQGIK